MQRKTPTSTPSSSPQSRKLKHPLLEGHVWDVNRGTLATTGKNGSHVVVPLEEALNRTLHFRRPDVTAAFEEIDNKIEKLEKEHKAAIEAVAAIAKQEEENRKRQEEEIRKRNHKVASLLEQVIENLQQVVVELKQ